VQTGRAHWETLLRARAIENQAFVLAADQGGRHVNGRETWGHSMIIDPWGQILAQQDEDAGVSLAELDLAQMAQLRARLPALTHCRL
jgi:nitrilase